MLPVDPDSTLRRAPPAQMGSQVVGDPTEILDFRGERENLVMKADSVTMDARESQAWLDAPEAVDETAKMADLGYRAGRESLGSRVPPV